MTNTILYVRDPDTLEKLDVIENASVIWERRFLKPGVFQLTIQGAMNLAEEQLISRGDDLDDGNDIAVIEGIRRTYTQAAGEQAIVTGRFLAGYAARRVIDGTKTITGTYEYVVKKLATDFMSESAPAGKAFAGLSVAASHGYESATINYQETDKKLTDEFEKLAAASKLGYDIRLIDNALVFDVRQGVNRTINQSTNPKIIFAVSFENVLSQAFSIETTDTTNFAYVKMPAAGTAEELTTTVGTATGRHRREILVTGTNVTKNESGADNPLATQIALLQQQGAAAMTEDTLAFEATIDPSATYQYGVDYDLGDFASLVSEEWGITLDAQITAAREVEENGKESLKLTFGYDGFSFKKILQRMVL